MKPIITFIFLFIACYAMSQENKQLDLLNSKKKRIESEIAIKQDSLKTVNLRIEHLMKETAIKSLSTQPKGLVYKTVVQNDGKIRKESNPNADIITLVNKGDTVYLTDFSEDYWVVNKGPYFGYINELYIKSDEGLENFKKTVQVREEIAKQRAEEDKMKKELAEYKKAQDQRRVSLVQRFGKETGEKLLAGRYWIGMTEDMAIESLGQPETINSTVGSWKRNEQWVYSRMYLYFDDGVMTSYQTSL